MADVPAAQRAHGARDRDHDQAMADVPAAHHAYGARTVPPTVFAEFVVAAVTTHRTRVPTAVPATIVAAAAIFLGVSAHLSTVLAYYAAFAVSIVSFARAVSPESVDPFLAALDARVRVTARVTRAAAASACADLETDLRRLWDAARGHPVLAPVYARAEERARFACAIIADDVRGVKRWAEAKWSEHKDAAVAGGLLLRLITRVINLAAIVLISAAYEEAKTRAPSVLRHLRGVVREIKPPPCNQPEEGAAVSSGFRLKDMVCLAGIAIYLVYTTDMLVHAYTIGLITGRTQFYAVCYTLICGSALLVSDWVCLPDDSDETRATGDRLNTGNASRQPGNGGEARRDTDLEVRQSWKYMWLLIVAAYVVDVGLLRLTLGAKPVALAFLALCNMKVLNVGKRVHLAMDDDTEGSAEGDVDKWCRAAVAVLAASSVKVLTICVVLGFHLAALSFASLCTMAVLLLVKEESLSDADASGDGEGVEEGAGFAGEITAGAEEEETDEVRADHSNMSTEEPEEGAKEEADEVRAEHSSAEEGSASGEHCDISEERVEEQRQEEPDYNSGSSMDAWDFVEVDPELPIKANGGANRRLSMIFSWNHAA